MVHEILGQGHESARTAEDIAKQLGITSREVRRAINAERREVVILNLQDGEGYFIPTEKEEDLVVRWVRQEESRLKKHALALRAGRRAVKGGTINAR